MPTWIVDPRSPALATSTTGAPQHKLTISFINSLLWFLLVKSFIVFLCFVGLEISNPNWAQLYEFIFSFFTRPRLESQRPSWVWVSFKLRSERREGRSESKGLIRIKSGVAGRLRGKASRR